MYSRRLLIFDFDNTLVDTRGVGAIALREVEALLLAQGNEHLMRCKDQLFQEFERNLRARGEDKSGRVDIETWRSRLWMDAVVSVGLGEFVTESLANEINSVWKKARLHHLRIPDDVQQMLIQLRREFSLCLLTNGHSTVQNEKIEAIILGKNQTRKSIASFPKNSACLHWPTPS